MDERLRQSFDHIQAGEGLKRRTSAYLVQQAFYRQRVRSLRRWALAAACALLLTVGSLGGWLFFTPVSTISVDINPSLELNINRFDRVVSVDGFNEAGQALAQNLELRFVNYTEAFERLLADVQVRSYLDQGEGLSLLVVCDDQERSGQMLAQVEGCTSGQQNVHCHAGGSENAADAHAAGLSCGKYRAYLQLRELDPTVAPEDVEGLSMREIRQWIQEAADQEEAPAETPEPSCDNKETSSEEAASSSEAPESSCESKAEAGSHNGGSAQHGQGHGQHGGGGKHQGKKHG